MVRCDGRTHMTPDFEAMVGIREWATREKSNWAESRRWRMVCSDLVRALDEIIEGEDVLDEPEGEDR